MAVLHSRQEGLKRSRSLTGERGLDPLVTYSKLNGEDEVVAKMHYELRSSVSVHISSTSLSFLIIPLYLGGLAAQLVHVKGRVSLLLR